MATNGAEIVASELMVALLTGEDVSIPTIDFSGSEYSIPGDINSDAYDVLVRLSDSDLTTGAINGTGAFDKLMVGVAAQLQGEYDAGRITGVEYTKAYIALTGSALSSSLQYLLSRDAAYWQAVQAQAASVTARVQLATAKIQNAAAKLEAMNVKANYALAKLKLSTMDIEYATGKYNLDNILPAQNILLTDQHNQTIQQTSNLATEQDNMIKQGTLIDSQKIGQDNQNATSAYNLENLLPSQLAQTNAQTSLLSYDLTTVKPAEVANLNKQGTLLDSQKLGQDAQNNTAIYNLENLLPVQLATANAQKLSIDKANSISDYNLENILPSQLAMTNSQKIGQDKQNETAIYNLENLLPAQLATANSQKLSIDKQTETANYNLINLLPVQLAMTSAQKLSVDKANSISDYNLATVLPSQVAMTNAQKLGQDKQTETANYNLINLLPKQVDLLDEQIAGAVKDTETKTYTLDEIMPAQKLNLQEQAEAQRAQTLDTRSNGVTAVAGSIGRQNALYAQQVISYQKDAELKAGKIFSDIWTVRKTVDEGLPLPAAFHKTNIQGVMEEIMTSNGFTPLAAVGEG